MTFHLKRSGENYVTPDNKFRIEPFYASTSRNGCFRKEWRLIDIQSGNRVEFCETLREARGWLEIEYS